MNQYAVKITELASEELEALYQYIAQNLSSPGNALRQYNRIADAMLSLDTFPERFRVLESEPWHSMGLRRMTVDRYSVFYIVRERYVLVTDILYSASSIEDRLKGIPDT